jgi:hypothetical protein
MLKYHGRLFSGYIIDRDLIKSKEVDYNLGLQPEYRCGNPVLPE